ARAVRRSVDDPAPRRAARRVEILGDRGLAVGHHRLAGEFLRVDEEPRASLPCNGRAVVGMAFAIHTLAETDGAQKIDGAGLQHAGANATQDMRPALPLEHRAV